MVGSQVKKLSLIYDYPLQKDDNDDANNRGSDTGNVRTCTITGKGHILH